MERFLDLEDEEEWPPCGLLCHPNTLPTTWTISSALSTAISWPAPSTTRTRMFSSPSAAVASSTSSSLMMMGSVSPSTSQTSLNGPLPASMLSLMMLHRCCCSWTGAWRMDETKAGTKPLWCRTCQSTTAETVLCGFPRKRALFEDRNTVSSSCSSSSAAGSTSAMALGLLPGELSRLFLCLLVASDHENLDFPVFPDFPDLNSLGLRLRLGFGGFGLVLPRP
jgi:hypothetical protein